MFWIDSWSAYRWCSDPWPPPSDRLKEYPESLLWRWRQQKVSPGSQFATMSQALLVISVNSQCSVTFFRFSVHLTCYLAGFVWHPFNNSFAIVVQKQPKHEQQLQAASLFNRAMLEDTKDLWAQEKSAKVGPCRSVPKVIFTIERLWYVIEDRLSFSCHSGLKKPHHTVLYTSDTTLYRSGLNCFYMQWDTSCCVDNLWLVLVAACVYWDLTYRNGGH